ncbi:succinylglutamate desuccinylase/aspartoacylase family protein [Yersinia pekkanenii]|uniref:Succinylglutamate desuccinylase/aspartoacylase n=1 Tax=Yersinia pekkanenii TaxID=1288385 RepID=A0A0T9PA32_9GAMM|nr:succinylglutamate desuccinylase/aspartoacylase family protein [Yersinia pekkanenii]CNH53882.1 succinylglutamate desuccinylase/aspartoacylase [Yersinia pekkanenii]CRY67539.1 succinylglutamate desuccinylase/aspartoacylase [Yersinia pekkanenii]
MKINNHKLPEHALGGQRQLTSFHFGQQGLGEKIYLQAGLHADELPGMLVLHYLKRLLSQAERRGKIQSEIIIVPIANPPGIAQVLLNSGIGRFDLVTGRNFNRDFPDLAQLVQIQLAQQPLASHAATDGGSIQQQVRSAMVAALLDLPVSSEVAALRQHLLLLACDADLVLDLHCDDHAILHMYADPAWREPVDILARFLNIDTILLSQDSGGGSFDEACGLPWHRLAAQHPDLSQLSPACMAVTVELRGQQDVSHALASADAERLYHYLQYRGAIKGEHQAIPQREVVMLPFTAGEIINAPASGILLLLRQPGEWVGKDEVVAEIIDPVTDTVKAVRAQAGGIIYASRRAPFVTLGAEVMKIAGKTPYAGGGGLAM